MDRLRVLLVEDDPTAVLLLRATLDALPACPIDLAHTDYLDEAIRRLRAEPFDAVLLDLGLPGSSGVDTLLAMLRDALDIPIVVLTSLDDEAVGLRAVQEGAQDFLVKGQVSADAIVRTLRYAIERKRLLVTVRESEARTAAIIDTAIDAILTFDELGIVRSFNPAAVPLFLCSAEATLGQPIEHYLPGLHPLRTENANGAAHVRAELLAHRSDGKALPVEVSASELRLGDRRLFTVIVRDISDRKALDQQRRDFLAMLTHDIKGPLTVIRGSLDALGVQPELPEEGAELVEAMGRSTQTILSLIGNYLDLSRIEGGEVALHRRKVQIGALLGAVVEQYSVEAERRGIALVCEMQELPLIDADPLALERVFMNLVQNALKFTPDRGRVTIRSRRSDDAVAVSVGDSGPGIGEEERAALFQRYQQTAVGRSKKGTGLGLFIVKTLVEAHGGQVVIGRSAEGGAEFSVTLPRQAPAGVFVAPGFALPAAEEVGRAAGVEAALVESPGAPDDRRALVLVIDDNRDLNRVIQRLLSTRYRVAVAFDGQDGLEKALELRPDVILSDLMMPRLTGAELVRAARTHAELDAVPIVLLTAANDDKLRAQLLREGAQDYLTKPFSPEELHARIANLVERKRAEEAARHLLSIVEACDDAIVGLTLDGTITRWSGGAEVQYGYSVAEMTGQPFTRLFPPQAVAELSPILRKLERGESMRNFETFHCRLDGERFPVSMTLSPIRDAGGAVVGASAVVRDITERRLSEQLRASLKEKEVLVQEIQHRVKNNLQLVASLLSLQSNYVHDPQALEVFRDSQNRVRSMALVHDTLYRSRDMSQLDCATYMRDLISHIVGSYPTGGAIAVDVDVDDLLLGSDMAIPCGLIVNELVSNALKHAFPRDQRGEVHVELHRSDGHYVLKVSDNGVGIRNDQLGEESSLGLRLVDALTHQIDGTLQIHTEGKGTEFEVRFAA